MEAREFPLDRKRAGIMQHQTEDLLRTVVLANMLADLPEPSLRQKLAAQHFELCSTVSAQALAARLCR